MRGKWCLPAWARKGWLMPLIGNSGEVQAWEGDMSSFLHVCLRCLLSVSQTYQEINVWITPRPLESQGSGSDAQQAGVDREANGASYKNYSVQGVWKRCLWKEVEDQKEVEKDSEEAWQIMGATGRSRQAWSAMLNATYRSGEPKTWNYPLDFVTWRSLVIPEKSSFILWQVESSQPHLKLESVYSIWEDRSLPLWCPQHVYLLMILCRCFQAPSMLLCCI